MEKALFTIQQLGWNRFFADQLSDTERRQWTVARVTRVFNRFYQLHGEHCALLAELSGSFKHRAGGGEALPAVGDWVVAEPLNSDGQAVIHRILNRQSRFLRKTPGTLSDVQVIAANIDILFIVMGADNDYNPRRLERYLILARESGAQPVVVLNKTDLVDEEILAMQREDLQETARPAPVVELSALLGTGCAQLLEILAAGQTGAMVGSSGTGKSTLLNRLLGEERQKTGGLRDDQKGRHTTIARELFCLPGGQLLIDTPGIRELQLWVTRKELLNGFPEIAEAASHCRFRDCAHQNEPGCGVLQAVEAGEIDPDRLEHFRKLDRELARTAERRIEYRRSGKRPGRRKNRR